MQYFRSWVLKVLHTEPQGSARETSELRELFVYLCFYFLKFIVGLCKLWSISSWAP